MKLFAKLLACWVVSLSIGAGYAGANVLLTPPTTGYVIAAADFFTTEVWIRKGLVTYYTLFVIDLKTRKIHIVGSTPHPGEAFMKQVARNLTDAVDGILIGKTHAIIDRDLVFTARVRKMLRDAEANPVRLPRHSPNLNALIERFVRSIKEERLDRVIPLGEAHLRELIHE